MEYWEGFDAVGFFAVRYEDLMFFFEATLLETAYLRRERGSLPARSSGETAFCFDEYGILEDEEWI